MDIAHRVCIVGLEEHEVNKIQSAWLKSIHDPTADFMEVDRELLADTQNVAKAFGLDLIANDYIVTDRGTKHLLQVNHVPNVRRFQ